MNKKILIVGIGGVGGYFGGLLAKSYHDRKETSVYFMARGENLNVIQHNGLSVAKGEIQFHTRPEIASDNPLDFGKVDYIVFCTKSYDIEETADKIRSCVKADTVFLPLLNGVDSAKKIKAMYPDNLVADGCAYIISRLIAPGQVQNFGNIQRVIFGVPHTDDARLDFLYDAFCQAGIETILTKDIAPKIWEKFIFISATATATSFYDKTFGGIMECADCSKDLRQLIAECALVAQHMNIALPTDIKEQVWKRFLDVSPKATTSMHSDYLAGKKQTEVRSLTGYILAQAEKYRLELPTYQKMYNQLINQ